MNSINFEQDQREDLNSVNDAKSLSDQVIKLKKIRRWTWRKRKRIKRTETSCWFSIRGGNTNHDARDEYLYTKIIRRFFSWS